MTTKFQTIINIQVKISSSTQKNPYYLLIQIAKNINTAIPSKIKAKLK